jgi:hypothetical protein
MVRNWRQGFARNIINKSPIAAYPPALLTNLSHVESPAALVGVHNPGFLDG